LIHFYKRDMSQRGLSWEILQRHNLSKVTNI